MRPRFDDALGKGPILSAAAPLLDTHLAVDIH
jgi:hypothetical protein